MNDTAMNESTASQPLATGTEISIVHRVRKAMASGHTEISLTELAKKHTDLVAIRDATDHMAVMGALRELRRHRLSIEKTGKTARDDATKFSRAIIAEGKRLIGIIAPEEDRLSSIRKEWDEEQERIRKEAEEKEEARKSALREKCFSFERLVLRVAGKPSSEVQKASATLEAILVTEDEFQEFTQQANTDLAAARERMAILLAETLERERQAEEVRAVAEKEAERRRVEAEKLAQQRAEQAAIERQQREAAAQLSHERAELERQQQEAAVKLARERAELERQQQEIEVASRPAPTEEPLQHDALFPKDTDSEPDIAPVAPLEPDQPSVLLTDELKAWKIKFEISDPAYSALLDILWYIDKEV